MRKILFIFMCLVLSSCVQEDKQLEHKIAGLKTEVNSLEVEKQTLSKDNQNLRESNFELTPCDRRQYIIVIDVRQSRTFGILDTDNYIKDQMNAFSFPIQVSESYYNSHKVGDKLKNDFRLGSFILKGSLSSWQVTVKEKHKGS